MERVGLVLKCSLYLFYIIDVMCMLILKKFSLESSNVLKEVFNAVLFILEKQNSLMNEECFNRLVNEGGNLLNMSESEKKEIKSQYSTITQLKINKM